MGILEKAKIYYAKNDLELVQKQKFSYISVIQEKNENGDSILVPRFTLNNSDIFTDLPANEPLKADIEIIKTAIKWGCILQIDYKGEEDTKVEGHERIIYPVAYGFSKSGKILVRGWHLKGWSVSTPGPVEKIWRMFRFDRFLNITFTGSFFRLAPEGYNHSGDKGIFDLKMHADFDAIRALQQKLINTDRIDIKDNVVLDKVKEIKVKDLNYNFKLFKPFDNNFIKRKDAKNTRLTFCKPLAKETGWIVIIGVNIEDGKTFKLKDENNNIIGTFTAFSTMMAIDIANKKIQSIKQNSEFKAYAFMSSKH